MDPICWVGRGSYPPISLVPYLSRIEEQSSSKFNLGSVGHLDYQSIRVIQEVQLRSRVNESDGD